MGKGKQWSKAAQHMVVRKEREKEREKKGQRPNFPVTDTPPIT
jgi:hypothetical protein